jgi:hypothetical protein
MTFAQSNAEFKDMPRHAVETGHVDFILSPAEIASKLLELNSSGGGGDLKHFLAALFQRMIKDSRAAVKFRDCL